MTKFYLSDIYVYPIKSLGGIRLETAMVGEKGLQYDRRWMLIEADSGRFMTIRNFPQFLFFRISLRDEGFLIDYKGDSLLIPFTIETGRHFRTTVWNDEVDVLEGDPAWNQWFSDKLGTGCKLVYMPERSRRPIKPQWGTQAVSFADGYPYLVIGKASLNALNDQLSKPVEMERFRPNLVFEGGLPYNEFRWSAFYVGTCHFQGLKPCARCVVTTYDPVTGDQGKEPLLTLSRQKVDDKIVFGQHAVAMDYNVINVGDEIVVQKYKESPYDPLHI